MNAIESILKQEEDKLEALLSDKFQNEMIAKLQIELKDLDLKLQEIKQAQNDCNQKQMAIRQEIDRQQVRIDNFQKEINVYKIQSKNEETKMFSRIEEAQLSLIIDRDLAQETQNRA